MSKKGKKKSRKQDLTTNVLLLTATLNLIEALIKLIDKLLEQVKGSNPLNKKYTTLFTYCQYKNKRK